MYLKRLELHGFKSFAPRTVLEFSPGITAIVGPNGSGKCIVGESRVTLADGRDVAIATLVDEALAKATHAEQMDDGTLTRENPADVRVLSLNPRTLRLEARHVTAFVKRTTPLELIRVRTRSGRSVTATPYHPLFTLQDGQLHALRADELREGLRIALPRALPTQHRVVALDTRETLASFTEEDRVYVSPSAELQAWAATAREQYGTWKAWRTISQVSHTQLDGFLQRQGVRVSVLSRLASTATSTLPRALRYSAHSATSIVLPTEMSPDLARFLGLVIAEGRNTAEADIRFVNADPAVNDEFERLARTLFDIGVFRRRYKENAEDLIIFSHALGHAMERLFGLAINSNSATKCVPPQIFEADAETQWAFLSGLFEGDGHIHVRSSKASAKAQHYIEYVTASETLARGVVALLLRLGVFALLRTKTQRLSESSSRATGTYYGVFIYGREQLSRAAQGLSFVGKKQAALLTLRDLAGPGNPNHDLVPGGAELVREAVRSARVSVKRHRAGHPKLAAYVELRCEASRAGIREVVGQIEELGETPDAARDVLDRLRSLADSDVLWDEIVAVERVAPTGPWVYDLCVDETHNFVAENIIVHNSNVADGIRWVLGEQSMRQLRGKKSDDVIFAGGMGRSTAQMAEVGLVLDNSSGWLPSEFTEVTIARRSFRNGDSEYLANGQRVRLKDVLLLLAQARIGHDSYTVIGQGLVDQALSLRAEERRGLFEDAAGIRQFQAQRTDAEQKLALTQNNLSRLHDIVGEIEPRLGPLAEQARRAHEYTGTREELYRLLQVWYRSQWRELHIALGRAELAEHAHAANIEQLREALSEQDSRIQELRHEREAALAEIARLRRERGEAANTLQTTEREYAVARERLASLDRQQSDIESEQEQQAEAIEVAHAHIAALEKQMTDAEEQARAAEREMEALARGQHAAQQEQEREEAKLRAAQREVIQVQARLGATQTELGRLQRQLGERNRTLAGRRDQVTQAQRKLDVAEQHLAEKRQVFEAARGEVEEIVAQREQLARDMAEGQTEIEQLRAAVGDGERERRALADRLALLEEWRRNLEGYGDGVRTILQTPAESRPHILGLVAQLVSAPAGLETAVEAAFGVFLQAVVVASQADARQAAHWLRESGGGRAIFLWPDAAAQATAPVLPAPDGERYLGFARDLVQCSEDLRPLFTHILRNAYIVRDLAVAEELCGGKAPPVPLITREGEMLHPRGWLRGGGTRATSDGAQDSSVLGRERELRQLPAEIERLAAEIDELKQRYDRAVAQQQQRKVQDEGLRKTLQKAEAQAQEHARGVTALQRDQERAHSELQLSQTVADQLAAEVQGIEHEVAATAERVAEQERAQQEATERVEDIQAELDDLLARNREQQEELTRARTALAVQMQETKALAQRAEQMRAQTREVEAQLARRGERLKAIAAQRDELTEATTAQEALIEELRASVRDLSEQVREHDTRQAELERQSLELERGQGNERQELARLEVEHQRCIMEAQHARDAIEALIQQVREELSDDGEGDDADEGESEPEESDSGTDPLRLLGIADDGSMDEDAATLSAEEMPKMRRQIDQLRSRLKHLGGYDPEAPQAYEELKTRYEFLTGQIRDMEQASTNLRAIIAELDQTMRRQFEETFRVVNERFQRHFTTLFNGGAARLELTAPRRDLAEDEDDEMPEASVPRKPGFGGVEVYVQIPGKKVQDLSLLSGGERAMVSAALLFALLETNPPPFCLLDEVDAALDEANVVRFCEILKQLAESTQFIVITHNRVTMTHANAIYGISMGGDSVSRVLSMQLEEATASVDAAAQIQGRRAAATRVVLQGGS